MKMGARIQLLAVVSVAAGLVGAVAARSVAAQTQFFYPAEDEFGTIYDEDNWPDLGDRDLNDNLWRYHVALTDWSEAGDGSMVNQLTYTLFPQALGSGSICSGIALRLPPELGQVATMPCESGAGQCVNRVIGHPPLCGAPTTDVQVTVDVDASTVLWISDDTRRELCSGAAHFINTDETLGEAGELRCQTMEVRIPFVFPTAVTDLSELPFDLFFHQCGRRDIQRHLSIYPGTDAFDASLFGTGQDGSVAGGPYFVQSADSPVPGLPYVINIDEAARYPWETADFEAAFPRAVPFAAGDPGYADFYLVGVNEDYIYQGVNGPPEPGRCANAPPEVTLSYEPDAVFVGDRVDLHALAADPDGYDVTYTWSFLAHPLPGGSPTLAFDGLDLANASFVASHPGTYSIQVAVSDGVQTSTAVVTFTTVNRPPTACAALVSELVVGEPAWLDADCSTDQDGDLLTYTWSFDSTPGAAPTFAPVGAPQTAFTPNAAGTYVVHLTVDDGQESDTFTLSLSTSNQPPQACIQLFGTLRPGTPVLFQSCSTDPDGDTLTYTWSITSAPAGADPAASDATQPSWELTPDVAGSYTVQLEVSDGTATDQAQSTLDANSRPVAALSTADAGEVGATITVDGSGSYDADLDTLSYLWALIAAPADSTASIVGAGPIVSLELDVPGEYVVQLIVNDGTEDSDPATLLIATENRAPVASLAWFPATTPLGPGTVINLDASASHDPDGDTLAFIWTFLSWPGGAAPSIFVEPDGDLAAFTLGEPGEYVVQVTVSDDQIEDLASVSITFANNPPVAVPELLGSASVSTGALVEVSGAASYDPEGATLGYFWQLTPPAFSAASLSSLTDVETTFVADRPGTYVISLVVSDGALQSVPESVSVTAQPALPPEPAVCGTVICGPGNPAWNYNTWPHPCLQVSTSTEPISYTNSIRTWTGQPLVFWRESSPGHVGEGYFDWYIGHLAGAAVSRARIVFSYQTIGGTSQNIRLQMVPGPSDGALSVTDWRNPKAYNPPTCNAANNCINAQSANIPWCGNGCTGTGTSTFDVTTLVNAAIARGDQYVGFLLLNSNDSGGVVLEFEECGDARLELTPAP